MAAPRNRSRIPPPTAPTPELSGETPLGAQAEPATDQAFDNAIGPVAPPPSAATGQTRPDPTLDNALGPAPAVAAPRARRASAARVERTDPPAPEAAESAPARPEPAASHALPEAIQTRYLQVGNDYHFVNGRLAFRDQGERLSTPLENVEVIRDLISIAQERGWRQIMLSGTDRFRSEAYQQARLAGLEVPAYAPTELERQQLAHRMRQGDAPERPRAPSAGPDPTAPTADAEPRSAPTAPPSERATERVYRGRLLDSGPAHYRFDPNEDNSYFVLLDTARGEEYVWGKDLERALESSLSRAAPGEEVVVRYTGSEPVTVTRPVRDTQGRITDEQPIRTERHRWTVETRAFLDERERLAGVIRDPRITPTEGVSRHPELAGTYDELYAAKLVAANQPYTKEEADRFVGRVRESIAQEIERGEPLSAPIQKARFRAESAAPRTHQRVHERVL